MFPNQTEDAITTVLKANNGDVDASIVSLLAQ
jgi:hypothetical protein